MKLTIVTIWLSLLIVFASSGYYEDGSWRLGPFSGCVPKHVCGSYSKGWDTPEELIDQEPLQAWSDPTDAAEALYVHAPDGTCGLQLENGGHTIKILLCEI